ncbi:unnamed protein product [Vicia faba]|uniref:Uncharacterized protein n=1 Tax=Vicia faba TaxID=3906 RepID=A0AAV0YYU7_VICFA|nr:unnamed protein product [Vicia faba]
MIVTTIIFGAVFWQKGKEINTHRDLFNVFGSINVFFYGLFICTASLLSTAVYTIFILFSGFLILGPMVNCGEDVTKVDTKPDGTCRVKAKSESECLDLRNRILADDTFLIDPSVLLLMEISKE